MATSMIALNFGQNEEMPPTLPMWVFKEHPNHTFGIVVAEAAKRFGRQGPLQYCDDEGDWCVLEAVTILDAALTAMECNCMVPTITIRAAPAAPAAEPQGPRTTTPVDHVLNMIRSLTDGLDIRRVLATAASDILEFVLPVVDHPQKEMARELLERIRGGEWEAVKDLINIVHGVWNQLAEDVRGALKELFTKAVEQERERPATPVEVHTRYTCDGCETTPIVGTRYHCETVQVDGGYDLCSRCYTDREHFLPGQSWTPFTHGDQQADVVGFTTEGMTSAPPASNELVVSEAQIPMEAAAAPAEEAAAGRATAELAVSTEDSATDQPEDQEETESSESAEIVELPNADISAYCVVEQEVPLVQTEDAADQSEVAEEQPEEAQEEAVATTEALPAGLIVGSKLSISGHVIEAPCGVGGEHCEVHVHALAEDISGDCEGLLGQYQLTNAISLGSMVAVRGAAAVTFTLELVNTGAVAWEEGTLLALAHGDSCGTPAVMVPSLAPGETCQFPFEVDISSESHGDSLWVLRSPKGKLFGTLVSLAH
mmetsp:Transcript_20490/g.49764  ORF Transcript_20490/g.49764 Transcript_20490/m.49764 type:complete len:542 (-) Transcript_20490:42-1667(-)